MGFCVGTHHEALAPERNRDHSIGDQVVNLNVGFMERLLLNSNQVLVLCRAYYASREAYYEKSIRALLSNLICLAFMCLKLPIKQRSGFPAFLVQGN